MIPTCCMHICILTADYTVKPVLSGDQLSLNAGQKYCRMLQGEHSAILLTFSKLPFVINIFVLSIFESPLKTGFTVGQFNDDREAAGSSLT